MNISKLSSSYIVSCSNQSINHKHLSHSFKRKISDYLSICEDDQTLQPSSMNLIEDMEANNDEVKLLESLLSDIITHKFIMSTHCYSNSVQSVLDDFCERYGISSQTIDNDLVSSIEYLCSMPDDKFIKRLNNHLFSDVFDNLFDLGSGELHYWLMKNGFSAKNGDTSPSDSDMDDYCDHITNSFDSFHSEELMFPLEL